MELLDILESRIRQDLTPFCDPGSSLTLERDGRNFRASWQQRRRDRTADFKISEPSEITVSFMGGDFSYASFFASEEMADVLGIAKTSYVLHRKPNYVETFAKPEEDPNHPSESAVELIGSMVSGGAHADCTTFVMVTGEAGAGKTWALKELVSRQAKAYLEGRTSFVYLYVDAQGRALAKFNEALATELNELRVGLPYHAVAAMVRLGLIVPVVDGFDELIGVGGYDDAFASIANFVEDLSGGGALVASARSTYYEQEFLSRANRDASVSSWRLLSAKVLAWGNDQRRSYIDAISSAEGSALKAQLLQKLSSIFTGQNADLASKPLFFTRTLALVLSGEELGGEGTLTQRLVDAFIHRELKDKLLDRTGSRILDEAQLQGLCHDMAEEMWNQSTRELDRATVKYIAEMGLSDATLSPSSKHIVSERMPSMAFFQPGDSPGSIKFEHEIFFDYFLSQRFAERLTEKGPLTTVLLGRSAMHESLADEVAKCLAAAAMPMKHEVAVLGAAARSANVKQSQVKENCGRLFGALAKRLFESGESISDLELDGFVFPGSDLSNLSLERLVFKGCELRRVNVANSKLLDCRFSDGTTLEAPLVSEETKLDVHGIDADSDIIGLRVVGEDGAVRSIYDPFELRAILRTIGFADLEDEPTRRDVDEEVVHLVDKISRAFSRSNPISFDDYFGGAITRLHGWHEVRKAGLESGIFKSESRQAHGPKREFIRRMVLPEDIAAGIDRTHQGPSSVVEFWNRLEALCPRKPASPT